MPRLTIPRAPATAASQPQAAAASFLCNTYPHAQVCASVNTSRACDGIPLQPLSPRTGACVGKCIARRRLLLHLFLCNPYSPAQVCYAGWQYLARWLCLFFITRYCERGWWQLHAECVRVLFETCYGGRSGKYVSWSVDTRLMPWCIG